MQISNRTIATLLIATILVYLGGTFISLNRLADFGYSPLTGRVTANVSVEISTQTSVTWVLSSIQWGAGYVNSSCNNCTMQVNNTASAAAGTYGYDKICCISFNWSNQSLLLKNDGNQNVDVMMNITTNSTNWFGTTAKPAELSFKIVDVANRDHDSADNPQDTTVACLGNSSFGNSTHGNVSSVGWYWYESASTWTVIDNWTGAPKYICGDSTSGGNNFTFASAANEANFDFRIVIPQNYTSTGIKSTLITILATN